MVPRVALEAAALPPGLGRGKSARNERRFGLREERVGVGRVVDPQGRALHVGEADVHLLPVVRADARHPRLEGLVYREHRVCSAVADVHLVSRGARGPEKDASIVDADDRVDVLDHLEVGFGLGLEVRG